MPAVRPPLALLAAVLALATLALPGPGAAAPRAEASSGATITTWLHPGWNMVGWVGPETPTSELFEAIPALERVWTWDAEHQKYDSTGRDGADQFPTVAPGMGVWLYLGGVSTAEWTRAVSDEPVLLSLRTGRNLVAWTGEDGTLAEDAFAGFGEALASARRWHPFRGYELHHPEARAASNLASLDRGNAVWVELREDRRWWQSGASTTDFAFADDVTRERRAHIRKQLGHVVAFFAEQYGIEPPEFVLRAGPDFPSATIGLFIGPPGQDVEVRSTLNIGSEMADSALASTLAHEYFHVLQNHLARYPASPAWMTEGSAVYAEALYVRSAGDSPDGESAGTWARDSASADVLLADLEDSVDGTSGAYPLGALATDWLVRRAIASPATDWTYTTTDESSFEEQVQRDSYIRYYRLLSSSETWQEAFEEAFGLTVEDFYEQFEPYRARAWFEAAFEHVVGVAPEDYDGDLQPFRDAVGRPLAHTTDDLIEPAIVFVGDVPARTRLEVETQIARVYKLLTERLGLDPYEFTLYFAADDESGRLAFFELYRSGAAGGRYYCAVGGTWVVFHSMTCQHDFTYQGHLTIPVSQLFLNTHYGRHPYWIELAAGHYAEALYRDVYGLGGLDGDVRGSRRRVETHDVPLKQLGTPAGWSEANNELNWDLTLLAAHWLAEHAGERAIIEYSRLLPRGDPERDDYEPRAGSWQAAFEQAFGLTISEFYDRFEAEREALRPPHTLQTGTTGRPVLVFLGDVSASDRGRVEGELAAVTAFYARRFGADLPAFSVYVGADRNAVRETFPDFDNAWCTGHLWQGRAMIALRPCGELLLDLFAAEALSGYDRAGPSPAWLVEGFHAYATREHRIAAGRLDRDLHMAVLLAIVIYEEGSLRAVETENRTLDSVEMRLAELAVEWLGERYGEPALVRYFADLTPYAPTWRQQFEATFGLTPDEFHDQFEAYRATLTLP